jgi:pyruvate-ferredoxin/flavodoxin oxidoreductase
VLVLDTEVYSNTGGQMSKSTPRGAVAQFAAGGKPLPKKDLAMLMMTYGNAYVARVAMGASPQQTVKAFVEAEKFNGPSIIIAYSHCIAHGFNLTNGYEEQKKAVNCGHWPLYRFNPELLDQGKNPLQLDSKAPSIDLAEYIYNETRFKTLQQSQPEVAAKLLELAKKDVAQKFSLIEKLANLTCDCTPKQSS